MFNSRRVGASLFDVAREPGPRFAGHAVQRGNDRDTHRLLHPPHVFEIVGRRQRILLWPRKGCERCREFRVERIHLVDARRLRHRDLFLEQ